MERKWKERYSQKFRRRAVARMNACDNIVRLSRELGLSRTLLYKWRCRLEPPDAQVEGTVSTQNSRESRLRREVNKLKRLLADKTLEVDFFRSASQKVEARRQQSDIFGEKASTTKFEMPLQGRMSIERMCQSAQVSRAGFYRYLNCRAPEEEDMTVRSAIQEIALERVRHYGYRRVTAELRRRGMMVNHKRVARMMRTDNLLTIQNRELRQVTGRDRELEIYLNLASRMNLRGPNQLWIADITYIRLKAEFVYLAVVLDAFSRKVVGWSLDRSLQARLPTSALEKAIMSRQPPPGLVHHSDQGVQYRCAGYMQALRDHRMVASISRPGYPYDNASCESFMKTLKREEIYARDYRDLEHLLESVEGFIENYYNRCRLHSALGYCPPEEFENESEGRNGDARFGAATMRVFKTLTGSQN
ncbi:MAG: IS3 family transposase [Acidobacteria bacterium]|nr:MAG: IS3 family transposase [Acidobacteriota bacterium]